ncbi:MAG: hypothetical protein ACRD3W_06510, partial [Terriglobales bacterium]
MSLLRKLVPGLALLAALAVAHDSRAGSSDDQDLPGRKTPSVSMAASPVITVTRGKPNSVNLRFRVGVGFHVNSNKPKSE